MKTAQAQEMKNLQSSIAMTVALVSWGMLFATLFLGYFLVRFNLPSWPPEEIKGLPQALPLMSTLVMILSSVTYYKLESKIFNDLRAGKGFWFLTFILGGVFLILQWFLWAALKDSGILISNGMVPSMVYAFTWIHAAHIILALFSLLWLGHFIFFKEKKLTVNQVMNVGKFWHFLGVVWLLMYLMIFVL